MVVQSPKFDDDRTFISTALSYNPENGVTSGFLGYIHDENSSTSRQKVTKGTMDNVLDGVVSEAFGIHSLNPLLLPVLILNSLHDFNENQLAESHTLIKRVEGTMNGMSDIFSKSWNAQQSKIRDLLGSAKDAMKGYDTAHHDLVQSQNTLLSESFPFNKDLGLNCSDASKDMKNWLEAQSTKKDDEPTKKDGKPTFKMPGLETLIIRLIKMSERHEGRRERLYKRMKVAIDAVRVLALSTLLMLTNLLDSSTPLPNSCYNGSTSRTVIWPPRPRIDKAAC